jgi:hypothetical protein
MAEFISVSLDQEGAGVSGKLPQKFGHPCINQIFTILIDFIKA